MNSIQQKQGFYNSFIWILSVAIPVVVGILLTPGLIPPLELGFNPYILPALNAAINSTVSILLVAGFILIKRKQILWHRRMMLSAFVLSALFLVSYVLYHLSVGHTPYCEDGLAGVGLYRTILISHILLSAFVVPLASFSIFRALSERIEHHRKLARITFPVWLYVSVTGVLVYLMIAPCHP